jgi:hypothetical protein
MYLRAISLELAQLLTFGIKLANPFQAASAEVIHYISVIALDTRRLCLQGLKARLQYLLTGAYADGFAGVVWPSLLGILGQSS